MNETEQWAWATDDAFTDKQWAFIDRIDAALHALGDATPSRVARKADLPNTQHVYEALRYLVRHQFAHTSGNGARTHYHPGRAA